MFVDRVFELRALEERYTSAKREFFIVFGRRRIGKTTLVKKFIETKKHIYFIARDQKIELEIERFTERIGEELGIYVKNKRDLEDVFRELASKLNSKEKTIIVIDEFTLWVKRYPEVLSEFQVIWDEVLSNSNVFLILTGSAVSTMETEVLGVNSPLYGRRTGQLVIEQLSLSSLRAFLPSYSFEDIIKVYSVTGGVPFYIKEFKNELNVQENLLQTVFNKSNTLSMEAEILLREELREIHVYFAILRAILEGANKVNEIASKSKVDITNLNKYLRVLMQLRLVGKEFSITDTPKSRNFHYFIKDNYFRFWLKYYYYNEDAIEENPQTVAENTFKDYSNYIGRYIFENICKNNFVKISGFHYSRIGRWWLKDQEIDLIALNEKTSEIFFAECKWQEKKTIKLELEKLLEKAKQVQWRQNKRIERFGFFSKKGFDKKAKQFAREHKIKLWNLADLEKNTFRGKTYNGT